MLVHGVVRGARCRMVHGVESSALAYTHHGLLAAHDAMPCLSVRTKPPMATGAPSQTIPYHTIPYHTIPRTPHMCRTSTSQLSQLPHSHTLRHAPCDTMHHTPRTTYPWLAHAPRNTRVVVCQWRPRWWKDMQM